MLPVMLASAEANDSSDVCGCLPQSFSVIVCLSFEAIDITAALARCVISRMEVLTLLVAGFTSAAGGADAGTLSATCADACVGAPPFGFGPSASLGAAGCGATGGASAVAAFEATLSGAAAENRSLNMSGDRAATVSGL